MSKAGKNGTNQSQTGSSKTVSHSYVVDYVCYRVASQLIQLGCGNARWLLSLAQRMWKYKMVASLLLGCFWLKGDRSDPRARSLSFLCKQTPLGVALDFLARVTQSGSLEWEPGGARFKLVEPITKPVKFGGARTPGSGHILIILMTAQ